MKTYIRDRPQNGIHTHGMDSIDDQSIINRVFKGEANAFGILVERYQRPIFNLMYRFTGSPDQAADLTQEAFIKAYGNLERFRPGSTFFPWLYAIGLNHARDFLRKDRTSQNVELDPEQMYHSGDPSDHQKRLDAHLDFQRLEKAMNKMPLTYRAAVVLRYREELSMREVATALDISLSAAKMRVSRGLEMLRQLVKGMNNEKG